MDKKKLEFFLDLLEAAGIEIKNYPNDDWQIQMDGSFVAYIYEIAEQANIRKEIKMNEED